MPQSRALRTMLALLWSLPVSIPLAAQQVPPLPDSSSVPSVLALAVAPDQALWVGTEGRGIYVLRHDSTTWEHIAASDDSTAHSISFDFVNAFAFGSHGEVWYGTVGNGWGVSTDGGRTWRNWALRQLGPEWQYIAPNGIVTRGDTVYVATADGIKLTWDDGATWRVVTDSAGVTTARDSVWGTIANQYLLAIGVAGDGALWVSHVHGIARSADGGRTWAEFGRPAGGAGTNRARAFAAAPGGDMWVGTEHGVYTYDSLGHAVGRPTDVLALPVVQQILDVGQGAPLIASDRGVSRMDRFPSNQSGNPQVRLSLAIARLDSARTVVGTDAGLYSGRPPAGLFGSQPEGEGRRGGERGTGARPRPTAAQRDMAEQLRDLAKAKDPKHIWFSRPIALDDQPYIDQTYRYGSTMGGYFQQHQGVEFNNADGTPVHAIGNGVVVYAGPAEAGALTVAIRHDSTLKADGVLYHLYSVYYHNSSLVVKVGDSVKTGDVISHVGNTGRATNDHLHLEVHAAPVDSVSLIVDPNERYPRFTTNPELWIRPLPGTGMVAGQVWDKSHHAVQQARIYGLIKPEPAETHFAFAETYGEHNRGTPVYHEHFAVSDVPPGEYVLVARIQDKLVLRRVQVEAGKLTWVVFKP